MTITNSTLSGNSSQNGAGIYNQSASTLTNVTLANNTASATGGGIQNSGGIVTLGNSLIGTNSASTSNDCAGTFVSQDYNLIQSTMGCSFSGSSANHQTGDPLILALADNNGNTPTHALSSNSPAIDTGSNSLCPGTDQRGFSRPADGDNNATPICDIGAYELDVGVSINDVSVDEANQGVTTTAYFTVSLATENIATVVVTYTTATDTAVSNLDFIAQTGSLTFNPGETTQTIAITISGDNIIENDETFFVNLTDIYNAPISDNQGVGTIINDDNTYFVYLPMLVKP